MGKINWKDVTIYSEDGEVKFPNSSESLDIFQIRRMNEYRDTNEINRYWLVDPNSPKYNEDKDGNPPKADPCDGGPSVDQIDFTGMPEVFETFEPDEVQEELFRNGESFRVKGKEVALLGQTDSECVFGYPDFEGEVINFNSSKEQASFLEQHSDYEEVPDNYAQSHAVWPK